MVVVHPTMRLRPRRKILNPMKNRRRASWRSRGRAAAILNTCHLSRPWLRKNRTRTRYCGFWTWCVMNSLSHCLTRIPSDAVMRLTARLNDQSVFTMTEQRCATKKPMGVTIAGFVELMNGFGMDRLASWEDSWRRISFVVSLGFCCRL